MTDYVDAGEAVPHKTLSATKGNAPATGDVNYERIQNATSEPENWLTYYGTYDAQRYSRLEQINKDTVKCHVHLRAGREAVGDRRGDRGGAVALQARLAL
jgi:glucose dehydrogenase